jgi:enoyl-CoA hydratase/carnithine racemase
MDYETIILERLGHTARITLNRPENLNSYNETMHANLRDAWHEINADENIWTIVVRGAGRAFCTGADMKEAASGMRQGKLGSPRWEAHGDVLNRYRMTSIRRVMWTGLPSPAAGYPGKPMISAIHGYCAGDGLGWLYSGDFAICSDDATFFDPHINVCVTPPGILQLARDVSRPMAFAMMFLGLYFRIDAQRAYELGLVSEVVPRNELDDRALAIADRINAQSSPMALRATRAYTYSTADLPFEQARRWARVFDNAVRFQTDDAVEGHRAYAEKRAPRWSGR